MWGKEGLCNIGQKRNEKKKKRKKHIFTCVPAMAAAGLARFEGRRTVERWGFEDPACGEKRSLQHWSEKKRKKEEKKHIFTYVPANEAMAAARLARLEGRGMMERWGFEDPACGEKRSLQWSEKKRKKEEKKHNFTCVPASAGNGGGGCGG